MKITFDDGSFIALEDSTGEDVKINVILCGIKGPREVTMSTLDLDIDQAEEMANFLKKWIEDNS